MIQIAPKLYRCPKCRRTFGIKRPKKEPPPVEEPVWTELNIFTLGVFLALVAIIFTILEVT